MSSFFLKSEMMVLIVVGFCQQSLQALKKISQEHPTACLRAGALMAVLSYLDFFSTGVQVTDGSVPYCSEDFGYCQRLDLIFIRVNIIYLLTTIIL